MEHRLDHDVMEILNPSNSLLSNCVITFIIIFKMPTLDSRQFSVIGPAEPIQASLGGEAELPCYLSPPQSAEHMEVVWFHSTHVVHVYRDGQDQFGDQSLNYQGRTELKRDAITSGNVTLKIWDVRYLDSGRYMCLLWNGFHQEEADMELKVLVFSHYH
ncbi:myelin-oligodendrocyte glycoprotein-like [Dromiciops gliroides]|uniref:myelin-oligodendrocyte glycoprotein-like n=1 Tax=Dromiciops gliroides TaxID=33562 RepID=UPI001CC446BF|nr:myelin-oligodendrocyte glycoprotein-like [Dromiciops gliroides]